jgi:hypothetical protein
MGSVHDLNIHLAVVIHEIHSARSDRSFGAYEKVSFAVYYCSYHGFTVC